MFRFGVVPENSKCPRDGSCSIMPLEKAQRKGIVPAFITMFFLAGPTFFPPMWFIKSQMSFVVILPSSRPLKNGSR